MKSVIDKFFDPPKKKRKLRRLLKDEEISHLCHLMDGQKDMVRLICDKSVTAIFSCRFSRHGIIADVTCLVLKKKKEGEIFFNNFFNLKCFWN